VSVGTATPGTAVPYADELLSKLWTTKAVRFEASKRLTEREFASRLSIAMLSVYVIAATVVELLLRQKKIEMMLFSFIGIVVPILILVLEGYEGAKDYRVRADRNHRSAQQVQMLHDRLARLVHTSIVTLNDLETIQDEYHKILGDFEEHHEDIDYTTVRASYPQRFNQPGKKNPPRFLASLNRVFNIWAMPACFLLLPAPFLAWAIIALVEAG